MGAWVLELHLTGMLVQAFVMCGKHFALNMMLVFFSILCVCATPLITCLLPVYYCTKAPNLILSRVCPEARGCECGDSEKGPSHWTPCVP